MISNVDVIVILLYLIGMLLIGWYFSRTSQTSEDYFLGGRSLSPWAVGLSLFATLLSSISYLSYPGEMIKYGPIIFAGMLAFPLVYYVVGWHLIPKFMSYDVTSAYEILEVESGVGVRILATIFFLSLRFLWMSTIIFATVDAAILPILNLDTAYSPLVSGTIALITVAYTSMGGIKAVVTTDVIQSIILLFGAIISLIIISNYFGSIVGWIPDSWPENWAELNYGFDSSERMTVGNAFIYVFVWYICTAGSDQMAIQRYLSTGDVKSARKTFGISIFINFLVQSLLALVGLAVFFYFSKNPNYLYGTNELFNSADNLFPSFIALGLPIGMSGLVTAGLIAAAMSSLSSGLNSSSSVIYEDFILRFSDEKTKVSKEQFKILRLISILLGLAVTVCSIFIGYVEGNLFEVIVKVVNLFVAPLFVLFFLVLFIPQTTTSGVIIGGLFSVLVAVVIAFFQIFGITILWIMPLALICGIIMGIVASSVEKKLISIIK